MRYFLYLCVFYLAVSCMQPGNTHTSQEEITPEVITYATGFTILKLDDHTLVEIKDPWQKGQLLQRYILIDRHQPVPPNLPKGTLVRVPIQNIVVYTSVHASIIDQLGEADKIIGVCEPQYMDAPAIREGIRSGRIADLGESMSPNIEKIIDIGAEVIIASPFQNSNYGQAEKIGIPIIEGADYMESLPLGRAEWGRFYGLLLNKSEEAEAIFRGTEERYLALKELATSAEKRPTVITEKKYGSFWYVPAGDSYSGHFYKDAGADYLFKDLPGAGSNPLSFETVLDEGIHADFWLIKYNATEDMRYEDLHAEYNPYANFDAYKNRNIYGCNTGKVPYYEEFPIHPDLLLKDLIHIFHPDLLPDHELRYYTRMKSR
ncbi:MAG: ABC transporter substrate-binding protein [Tannerellaceae bacterium]|nr:ABC transporter substrate-binding protein [Tannerellaceae bacterium]